MNTLRSKIEARVAVLEPGESTVLSVETLKRWLAEDGACEPEPQPAAVTEIAPVGAATWRERLHTAPADTIMTVADVAEALGRPKSFIHARSSPKTAAKRGLRPIPHQKHAGALVFRAGEIREWLREELGEVE